MAAQATTRNPLFVVSNGMRDYDFSSHILLVKEGAGYALKFQQNLPGAAGALQRYLSGRANLDPKWFFARSGRVNLV
jgi:hypothetical protein